MSAIIACEQFVQPLIKHMLGVAADQTRARPVAVVPTPQNSLPPGRGRVSCGSKLGQVGDRIVGPRRCPRGAGNDHQHYRGRRHHPHPTAQAEGIKDSDPVHAELLKPLPAIRNTIVIVGSHDNTLDVLADPVAVPATGPLTLSSSHVGSMGGLMAVKRGVCHLAGAHLLDTETGRIQSFLYQALHCPTHRSVW